MTAGRSGRTSHVAAALAALAGSCCPPSLPAQSPPAPSSSTPAPAPPPEVPQVVRIAETGGATFWNVDGSGVCVRWEMSGLHPATGRPAGKATAEVAEGKRPVRMRISYEVRDGAVVILPDRVRLSRADALEKRLRELACLRCERDRETFVDDWGHRGGGCAMGAPVGVTVFASIDACRNEHGGVGATAPGCLAKDAILAEEAAEEETIARLEKEVGEAEAAAARRLEAFERLVRKHHKVCICRGGGGARTAEGSCEAYELLADPGGAAGWLRRVVPARAGGDGAEVRTIRFAGLPDRVRFLEVTTTVPAEAADRKDEWEGTLEQVAQDAAVVDGDRWRFGAATCGARR
jgi:hypothetical protein